MKKSFTHTRPVHAFTVDVEEYFQVSAFDGTVQRSDWSTIPSRVDKSISEMLDLLERHDVHGTFFVLGWVAHTNPALVRRIRDAGHEIASHGFWHRRVMTESPAEFKADIYRAKCTIEDAIGAEVLGYRAPSFSIVRETEWAIDVLSEVGYAYDSSRFPVKRKGYGSPHVALDPHEFVTPSGRIFEIPMTTLKIGRARIAAVGGGWFRQFPMFVTRAAIRQQEQVGRSAIFYIHPWELDLDQPRLSVDMLTKIRHYRGLKHVSHRIEILLQSFQFGAIRDIFHHEIAKSSSANLQGRTFE